jgi:dephospho-CoA kinase
LQINHNHVFCYYGDMTEHQHLKLLAIVGLTGSGKSTAVDHFTNKEIPKVHFGNMAYEMMAERGIERGEENEKTFRVKIREEQGPDVYARRIAEQIHHLSEAGQHRVIVDGIYSWDEYVYMKHAFPGELTVVAVVAPKHLRYRWLEDRAERPQTPQVSIDRDRHEIQDIQKGGPIAAADFFVMNNGTLEHFFEQLDHVAEAIDF